MSREEGDAAYWAAGTFLVSVSASDSPVEDKIVYSSGVLLGTSRRVTRWSETQSSRVRSNLRISQHRH